MRTGSPLLRLSASRERRDVFAAARRAVLTALTALLLIGGAGCGSKGETADLDADFGDFAEVSDSDASKEDGSELGDTSDVSPSLGSAAPPAAALPTERLALRLKVGDRFPLLKTVEQRLVQGNAPATVAGTSLLELQFSLEVEEVRTQQKRLRVTYHRVRYLQQFGDRKVDFNSDQPTAVPAEALPYAGLVNNGFSFWLGADHRVTELVGFREFIERCLLNVPPEQRDAVYNQIVVMSNDDGVANFIDDTVGLLPSALDARGEVASVTPGSLWTLPERRIDGPVPMSIETRCMLKELNDREAVIEVSGRMVPTAASLGQPGLTLTVKSGQKVGSCTVDRASGLPTNSRANTILDMTVQLADGTQIPQRKETITTIRSFPDQTLNQPALTSRGGPLGASIEPASASRWAEETPSRVTPAGGATGTRWP